jgi:hypothetical protein
MKLVVWTVAIVVLGWVAWGLLGHKPPATAPRPAPAAPAAKAGVPVGAASALANAAKPIAYGLTFALVNDPSLATETAYLSCHGEPQPVDRPHKESCNPFQGDTSCRTVLPVLCAKVTGQEAPANAPAGLYQAWMHGSLGATQPIMGAVLESEARASALCDKELGAGWRMAEFVDGPQGWGLQGQRGLGLGGNQRYWVHSKAAPANCWNSAP